MNDVVKRISRAALSLSPSDRLELVEQLLESLDVPDQSIDRLWAAEADERLTAYRRGEIEAVPVATVLAKYAAQ